MEIDVDSRVKGIKEIEGASAIGRYETVIWKRVIRSRSNQLLLVLLLLLLLLLYPSKRHEIVMASIEET